MARLTEDLVAFIAAGHEHTMPDRAGEVTCLGFTDSMGVMIAGLDEPVFDVTMKFVRSRGGCAEARLVLGTEMALAEDAALVGAATAHALDYDDYAFSNHVSAVLVPAILAEGERVGASGSDMVRAYTVGYEAWREIMLREPDDIYTRGWHPTAVFGAFGVVAAASVLNRLGTDHIRNAIGLAVAQGGGVMANFGTMGKPYQGGRAAQAGLASIRLAMAGVDSSPDALDGDNGYLLGLSPQQNVDVTSPADKLGVDWAIGKETLNIKRYPTVGSSQRGADCATQLHHSGQVDIDQIECVRPYISERHARTMQFHLPQTGLEAKFSMEFVAAAGLISGAVGFAELKDEFVQRADVQALMKKVKIEIGPDDDPVLAAGTKADVIRVDMKDGSTVTSDEVARWKGHNDNPMTTDELKAKFMDCAGTQMDAGMAEDYFNVFQNVPDWSSVDDVPRLKL